jgi:chromosome segregation ATPase
VRVDEVVVLDAVAVAALAQSTRERAREAAAAAAQVLHGYAAELDEIAEAAVQLDQREHEIEHQLRWWADRIRQLEAALTGHPTDDMDTSRELALYRGRVSGAETLRKHYIEQRRALLHRHTAADAACTAALAEL